MSFSAWEKRREAVENRGLLRSLRTVEGAAGPVVDTSDGRKVLFCSNDYLGLASHPDVAAAVSGALEKWGVGAAASRLISGNTSAHSHLEKVAATFMETDDAVLFSSGYQANIGALSCLADSGDTLYSDQLVHASLVDGCRLSDARTRVYRHSDMQHLEQLLGEETDLGGLKIIVTDAVFSMDGDVAPIKEICSLTEEHDALVYLDEAHALGVMGPAGGGLAAREGVVGKVAVRMGTFGKAAGVSGAIVACESAAAALLRSRARSLLYTTACPAALVEGIVAALEVVAAADDLRARLTDNIAIFQKLGEKRGLPILSSQCAIQPVVIGDSRRTMAVSDLLWEKGFFVRGIRPPTVAEGTSRLRVTLTAAHDSNQVEALVDALADCLNEIEG